VPKVLSAPRSFAQYHPTQEATDVTWVDSIRGRLDGPFFHFKDTENPIKVFYVSGNYRLLKFNTEEGGECVEVIEGNNAFWFNPIILKKNVENKNTESDDDDFVVV